MTTLTSRKSTALTGAATVPGDKSISHRAVMLAALAEGESMIYNLLQGEDVLRTVDAMVAMGAKIEQDNGGVWHVEGTAGKLKQPSGELDMGNSGTSTRLLMGVVAGHPIRATFHGDASLTKRPMKRVMEPLGMMGATFQSANNDTLPLTVKGSANLKPVEYAPPVASAQVKSAILLAGLNTRGETSVIEQHPTRDHTENMLQDFGATVEVNKRIDDTVKIVINGPQKLLGCAIDVPADPSSAAFPAVAALLVEGSDVTLSNVCVNPYRIGLYTTLKEMGADIQLNPIRSLGREKIAQIVVKHSPLKGITVPADRISSMIDEIPVLAMAAACAEGITTITNLSELRKKESDRLALVYQGLKDCGVDVTMNDLEHSLIINGNGKPPKGGASIKTELDHRIAMCFLVLGTVTDEPITIDDAAPIKTSFPNFVKLMNDLGTDIS